MKAWSLFYPDVLPELPGAPLPLVDHWLRNAAIEFCERSKAHVETLVPVDAVASQMAYVLPMPTDGAPVPVTLNELVEIVSVRFSGEKLTPRAPQFLDTKYDDWEAEVGTPADYTQADTENVLLVPAPADAAVGAIVVRAALKPTSTATGIADWLYSQYRQALCAGAKAKMMAMENQPWTRPDLVALNLGIFEEAISKATTSASDGHVRSRPRFSGSFC